MMPKMLVQEQQLDFQEPGVAPLHDQHMALAGHRRARTSHDLQPVATVRLLGAVQGPLSAYHIYRGGK